MSELIREAMDRAAAVVRACNDPARGMTELLAFCRQRQPRSKKLWDSISRINFATDALRMRSAVAKVLDNARLGSEYTGFYFGLDGDNNANGKGIEFSCSKAHKPGGRDVEFAYEGESLPDIPSAAITQLYQQIEIASFADHCICLGYLGLALRSVSVFESLSTATTVGDAPERAVCCGFSSGDLMLLGIVGPNGLEVTATFPPAPERQADDLKLLPGTRAGGFFQVHPAWAGFSYEQEWEILKRHSLHFRGEHDPDSTPVPIRGNRPELKDFDITDATGGGGLIMNEVAAEWLRQNVHTGVQFIDTTHATLSQRFTILSVLKASPCLNLQKSEVSPALRDPNEIGQIWTVVIDSNRVPSNLLLFRLAEQPQYIIATMEFRNRWNASGLRGLRFDPILST